MHTAGPRIRLGIVLAAVLLGGTGPRAEASQWTQRLTFSATDLPRTTDAATSTVYLPVLDDVDARTEGEIRKVDLDGVALETLQAAWDEAVAECDARSYGFVREIEPFGTFGYTVSPTRQQCIDGVRLTYPSSIKYCSLFIGPDYPCGVNTTTITIAGAGPRPAATSSDVFDAGARFAMTSTRRVGFELASTKETGTVDITYAADATLTAQPVGTGDVRITSEVSPLLSQSSIVSDYADSESFAIRLQTDLSVDVAITACLPPDPCQSDSDGSSRVVDEQLLYFEKDRTSTGLAGVIPDYTIEFLSPNLVEAFGVDYVGPLAWSFGAQTLIDTGLPPDALELNLGIPIVSTGGPFNGLPPASVNFVFGDLGLYSPTYDLTNTYACAPEWDLGDPDGSGCIDDFFLDGAGALNRTQEPAPGARTTLQSGELENIVLASDLFRFDLDLDFLAGGGTGLGAEASVPLVASLTAELGDLDLATFWGRRQRIRFDPRLEVRLAFSEPTRVDVGDGAGFVERAQVTVPAGGAITLRKPSPFLEITPTWSVARNVFTNVVEAYVDFAIEEKLLAAASAGAGLDAIGDLVGEDLTRSYAALQLSVGLGDLRTATLVDDTFTQTGFPERTGAPIVPGATLDRDGDGLSDLEEALRGTAPDDPDTDDDLIGDADELDGTGTDPTVPDPFGHLYLTEREGDAILRIALGTDGEPYGTRTLVSGAARGSGPALVDPIGIAAEPSGTLLVVLPSGSLVRVDPATGDRTPISGPGIGSGPSLGTPTGIALMDGRTAYVADQGAPNRILRVDLETGDRAVAAELLSEPEPVYLAVEAAGTLLLGNQLEDSVYRFRVRPDGTLERVPLGNPVRGVPGLVGVAAQPGGGFAVTAKDAVRFHDGNGALRRAAPLPRGQYRGVVAPHDGAAYASRWDQGGTADAVVLARAAAAAYRIVTDGTGLPGIGFPAGLEVVAVRDGDGDGLGDLEELRRGLDPSEADTDGDGLDDGREFATTFTDPRDRDTDGDGAGDGDELEAGTDPRDGGSVPPPDTITPVPLLPLGAALLQGLLLSFGARALRFRRRAAGRARRP